MVIMDRDATILSSREIAYGCYEDSFDKIISNLYPPSSKLSITEYTRYYNPFEKTGIYEVYYPLLSSQQMERITELNWQFYLKNCRVEKFNKILPGMDRFIRKLKEYGCLVVVLTASDGDGIWMRHYNIPIDGFYSVIQLQKSKIISCEKSEAIGYILKRHKKSPPETVTIGDNPNDHVDGILSIGTAFGLGCPAARRMLKNSVDLYAPRVEKLYDIFGLKQQPLN